MSAQYPPQPAKPAGSIVERATSILDEQRPVIQRRDAEAGSSWNEMPVPLVSELEKSFRDLREQVQDLVHAFARLGEHLPTAGSVPLSNPLDAITSPSARLDGSGLPVLRNAEAPGGEIARTALGLINDASGPASVVLRATNLVSDLGDEIPGRLVTFFPNPLTVPARGEMPIQVAVRVPSNARPGTYSGLVQAAGLEGTRAVMIVNVKPHTST